MAADTTKVLSIQKENITFVVCGKIGQKGPLRTSICLASIRQFFPSSKIILSTWQGEPLEELCDLYDEVVLSDAALAPLHYSSLLDRARPNTVNLQQISGHAGMSRVRTKWAVKTRTDFVFTGDDFLYFYQHWIPLINSRIPQCCIFQCRVLVPWLFTKNPEYTSVAYQLSDFFQFGLTEDLLLLWDGHQESSETMNYFTENPNSLFENPEHYNHLYNVEQSFFLNVVRPRLPVYLPRWYCDPVVKEHLWEIRRIYASNILTATLFELGLKTRWEYEEPVFKPAMFLSFQTLLQWYLDVCDSDNRVCKDFLTDNPAPQTAPLSLMRKIRMTLREYKVPWTIYHFIKHNILKR